MNLMLAAFLVAHAAVHVAYLTPAPARTADGPEWPFELGRSWLVTSLHVDAALVHVIGIGLVAATTVLFVASALATIGWLPASWWPGLVVAAASTSLMTLTLFFHPWLLVGVVIDAALIWVVLAAGWVPPTGLDA